MNFEQPIRDMNSVIGVDSDQVSEGRVMELRQDNPFEMKPVPAAL
jgi:hypothetical protein